MRREPDLLPSTPAVPAGMRERIAVVVPCYRVKAQIMDVLARIGPECTSIFVVDDCCPEQTGSFVEANNRDPRVRVVRSSQNQGVGGAVLAGYRAAIAQGATIIVKIDGDGQMAPELLPAFVAPILDGSADYTKGNRFYDLAHIRRMPTIRIVGNAALSFAAKLSSGYWDLFDPTNGYTAISAEVATRLPLGKISKRYFFETDILFRLNTVRAVVVDIPMDALYGEEKSNLPVLSIMPEFLYKHARNFLKRIFYNYFLRDFSAASVELLFGVGLVIFGTAFGVSTWSHSAITGQVTPPGTVMLAALPLLVGVELVIAFLNYDVHAVPRRPIHRALRAHSDERGTAGRLSMRR